MSPRPRREQAAERVAPSLCSFELSRQELTSVARARAVTRARQHHSSAVAITTWADEPPPVEDAPEAAEAAEAAPEPEAEAAPPTDAPEAAPEPAEEAEAQAAEPPAEENSAAPEAASPEPEPEPPAPPKAPSRPPLKPAAVRLRNPEARASGVAAQPGAPYQEYLAAHKSLMGAM